MSAKTPATKWHHNRIAGFDTETTGVNPFTDRIVTAAIVHHTPGDRPRSLQWLIDPGVDIPTEASDVHKWTRDKLDTALSGFEAIEVVNGRATGVTREGALAAIAGQLSTVISAEAALVAANAAFDLTLLDAELARHGIDPIATRPKGHAGVIDPMVLEKQFDPYRKVKGGCRGGKHSCGGCGAEDKKLESLCRHYGVPLTAAHDAAADALAAVRLAVKLMEVWPDSARLRLPTLHAHQVTWRREQMDGLRSYFDRAGIEHDGCCGEWPLHSVCAQDRAGVSA